MPCGRSQRARVAFAQIIKEDRDAEDDRFAEEDWSAEEDWAVEEDRDAVEDRFAKKDWYAKEDWYARFAEDDRYADEDLYDDDDREIPLWWACNRAKTEVDWDMARLPMIINPPNFTYVDTPLGTTCRWFDHIGPLQSSFDALVSRRVKCGDIVGHKVVDIYNKAEYGWRKKVVDYDGAVIIIVTTDSKRPSNLMMAKIGNHFVRAPAARRP